MHVCDLFMLENREVSRSPACGDGRAGRAGKARGRNPVMHDREKSDGRVLPVKLPNNAQGGAAEAVEGRRPAKGNATSETRSGPSAGQGAPSELDRVRRMAQKDKDARFTALLHHVDVDRLRAAYWALEPEGRAGGRRRDVGGLRARISKRTFAIFTLVSTGAHTGRGRRGGRTYRSRTGGCGRSGSLRWRTRSCSGRWSRC